jgi:hypothetical protein
LHPEEDDEEDEDDDEEDEDEDDHEEEEVDRVMALKAQFKRVAIEDEDGAPRKKRPKT